VSDEIEFELRCIWRGKDQPRALKDRHEDDCEDDECRGCLQCPRYHCIVCGIKHVDRQTCPECVGVVRGDLRDIASMYLALRDHAISGGQDGRLEASRDLPGGEAMNMLVPGGQRGYIGIGEHRPTENVLGDWENDWRKITGNYTDDLVSVEGAWAFLDEHLSWAAQHHLAFDDFAKEIRAHRAHLEDVLHEGERAEKTAPCLYCGGRIEREYHKRQGFLDHWRCQGRCQRSYSRDQYLQAVKRGYIASADKLTASDAARRLGIPATRIRVWGARYPELKAGRNEQGLWLYKVSELEAKLNPAQEERDVV